MPRPPLTDGEFQAGRDRIVNAALDIVETKGIDALSMRTLGEAVGLTPGALYRYFANKDEVTEAVFGGADELDNRVLAAAGKRGSDTNAVRHVLRAYADFAFEDEDRFRTLFLKNHGPAGRAFHARGAHRPGARAARERIAAAIRAGAFRKLDADLAFQMLWSAVHGAVVLILTAEGFPFAQRDTVVNAAIDNALRGIAAAAKRGS